jgi:hypothetical protein
LLPSALFLDGTRIHFGPAARLASQNAPDRELIQSFKMLLGASDLERSLGRYLARGADPERAFTQRDLIVLYFAFLLGAVRRALQISPEPDFGFDAMSIRYAYPGWSGPREDDVHTLIARMFDEAEALEPAIGEALFSHGALSYADARAELTRIARQDLPSRIEGPISEGAAAATCFLLDAAFEPAFALVVDVGAGTTDIAGFAVHTKERGARIVSEIVDARSTISVAGDAIDFALMNVILEKSGRRQALSQQTELWRKLLPDARALKETIFTLGKGAVRLSSQTVTVRLADLVASPDFKDVKAALGAAYAQALHVVAERARAEGAKQVGIILTGGSARLPFLRKLVESGPKSAKIRTAPQPLEPSWVAAATLGRASAAIFPLVAVAVGGVLACPSALIRTHM